MVGAGSLFNPDDLSNMSSHVGLDASDAEPGGGSAADSLDALDGKRSSSLVTLAVYREAVALIAVYQPLSVIVHLVSDNYSLLK